MEKNRNESITIGRKAVRCRTSRIEEKTLEKNYNAYISTFKWQNLSLNKATIIWERLSTGCRVADIQVEKLREILEVLKVIFTLLLYTDI